MPQDDEVTGRIREREAGAVGRMRDLAGPDLYRRNAFRVTGLPTDASGRVVRERRQKVSTALAVGAPVEPGGALPLPVPATPDQIRSAFDVLGDARHRIVHELFWLWDTPDAGCSCVSSLHRDHDGAVRAHALALDRELDLPSTGTFSADALWGDAIERWNALLCRAALWDHLRHRVCVLDDRRLDESTVQALRDDLPRALVSTVVDLAAVADDPARLTAHAVRWDVGQHIVDDLLTEAAAPLLGTVDTTTTEAGDQLDAGRPLDAAANLRRSAIPALTRLEALVPHERHSRTATARNTVAALFNNCATALMDLPSTPSLTVEIRNLFDTASELVVEPQTHRTIESNRAGFDEREQVNRDLAPFGLTAENGGLDILAGQVQSMIASGRFDEARRILEVLRRYTADPDTAREIDLLLIQLKRGYLDVAPARGDSPETLTELLVAVIMGGLLWGFIIFLFVGGIFGSTAAIVIGALWCIGMIFYARDEWRKLRDRTSGPRRRR